MDERNAAQNPIHRKIIHVDMDAFFASVEQRDNPDYRGKPIVVGGTPEARGVVAAASYEARAYGIHSAMPSRTASQRCPQLIFVRPRFELYGSISQQIREIFLQYTDLVEPLSLDEAYLDVTTNKRGLGSATNIAKEIKAKIYKETGLTSSAGISINKFLAKSASSINKPNGLFLIPPEEVDTFLENLAIEKFYGIGRVTAEKMRKAGIYRGADLKRWSERDLVGRFGKLGSFYFQIVRGNDDRPVVPDRIRKSLGAEESYAEDLQDLDAVMLALNEIAKTLQERVERSGAGGRTLTLKVKYGDYQIVSRSRTAVGCITTASQMLEIATSLLQATEAGKAKSVRLLGLSLSNLESEADESEYKQLKLAF